jgi:hypothetical protein
MKPARISVVLLVMQLAIVSSIAAKYLYERWTCPRVWTRAVAYDPQLPMRGRYLSLQLVVDGCQSSLPSGKEAAFPRDVNGVVRPGPYSVRRVPPVSFPAELKVENNRLLALNIQDKGSSASGLWVEAPPGAPCQDFRLDGAVDFYISEHAVDPTPLKPGQELWIEVTVPRKGPPRPIQLALKDNGAWKPLAFQ